MKTWIVHVNPSAVKVYLEKNANKRPRFCTEIIRKGLASSKRRKIDFVKYVAEEMEIACGCGTDGSLILYGDLETANAICKCLSEQVRAKTVTSCAGLTRRVA